MTRRFCRRLCLIGSSLAMASLVSPIQPVRAQSVEERLELIDQSMELCLLKASRPGFPYYDRPEAAEACNETKKLLKAFAKDANRNRNLACSSRAMSLDFDLWMIQFLGGTRMRNQTEDNLSSLGKNCFNMNSRN